MEYQIFVDQLNAAYDLALDPHSDLCRLEIPLAEETLFVERGALDGCAHLFAEIGQVPKELRKRVSTGQLLLQFNGAFSANGALECFWIR